MILFYHKIITFASVFNPKVSLPTPVLIYRTFLGGGLYLLKVYKSRIPRPKPTDEFSIDGALLWQNAGSSWRNFERIKYLRAFLEAIKIELIELEKDPIKNREDLVQEKTLSEAMQKEIRRLERKTFYEELGE